MFFSSLEVDVMIFQFTLMCLNQYQYSDIKMIDLISKFQLLTQLILYHHHCKFLDHQRFDLTFVPPFSFPPPFSFLPPLFLLLSVSLELAKHCVLGSFSTAVMKYIDKSNVRGNGLTASSWVQSNVSCQRCLSRKSLRQLVKWNHYLERRQQLLVLRYSFHVKKSRMKI